MIIDELLKILNEEIESLERGAQKNEELRKEIGKLQKIIDATLTNPFGLYNLDSTSFDYVTKAIGMDSSLIAEMAQSRIIYDAYCQFGKEAVPQISSVEQFVAKVKETLENQKDTFSDQVAESVYSDVFYRELCTLKEELTDEEKPVDQFTALNEVFKRHGISVQDRIAIKMEINNKNNNIYAKTLPDDIKEDEPLSEYDKKISKIENNLESKFNPATLNTLKAVSELISKCQTKEEVNQIIDEWEPCFGGTALSNIIDGLISLKDIELLTLKELIPETDETYKIDLDKLNMQIEALTEYKEDTQILIDMEQDATKVEVGEILDNKFLQLLSEYNPNPMESRNIVLFLTDSIAQDVESIDDRQALEDAFVLIEQLKNDRGDYRSSKFSNCAPLRDLGYLRANSRNKQVRVVYAQLSDNIYGIIAILPKKADRPKRYINTLAARRKNCDIDSIKAHITEEDVLKHYIEKTETISAVLVDSVKESAKGNVKVAVGGAY